MFPRHHCFTFGCVVCLRLRVLSKIESLTMISWLLSMYSVDAIIPVTSRIFEAPCRDMLKPDFRYLHHTSWVPDLHFLHLEARRGSYGTWTKAGPTAATAATPSCLAETTGEKGQNLDGHALCHHPFYLIAIVWTYHSYPQLTSLTTWHVQDVSVAMCHFFVGTSCDIMCRSSNIQ